MTEVIETFGKITRHGKTYWRGMLHDKDGEFPAEWTETDGEVDEDSVTQIEPEWIEVPPHPATL